MPIGAALGGGVGAIIGGLSGSTTTKDSINGVVLKLIVNDTSNPIHFIDFIELTSTGETESNLALSEAQAWQDLLKVIIEQCKSDVSSIQSSKHKLSTSDELVQCAELHKADVLTDKEFSIAKDKILRS